MTEIKILLKSFSDIDQNDKNHLEERIKDFKDNPCDIYINGEKQTDVSYFAIDLPIEEWQKNNPLCLDDTNWHYLIEKKLNCN